MRMWFRLLRIHHYPKNLLVLLPIFFGGQLLNGPVLGRALLGCLCFCLCSSAVYILNDIRDVEQDRQHPRKRDRPVAAGQIPLVQAGWAAALLLTAAFGVQFLAFGFTGGSWVFLLLYLLINLGYSLGLKHIPILDVAILAAGFLIRLLYGAAITGIVVSNWLYLTVTSVAFFLSLGKRRGEMLRHGEGGGTRPVLAAYTEGFLDKCMYLMLALGLVFYSLWSVDPVTVARLSSDQIFWTVPLVILICLRYCLILEGGSDGDPMEVLLHDKMLLVLILLLMIAVGYFVYV